jgi:hypothetical protein
MMTKETWKQSFKDCFKEIFDTTNIIIQERTDIFWSLNFKDSKKPAFAYFHFRKGDFNKTEIQIEGLQFISNENENRRLIRVIDKIHLKDIFKYILLKKEVNLIYTDILSYNRSLGLQRDKKIEAILK